MRYTAKTISQRDIRMAKLSYLAILSALALSLSACNTVRGFGDDLKSVADAVDEET